MKSATAVYPYRAAPLTSISDVRYVRQGVFCQAYILKCFDDTGQIYRPPLQFMTCTSARQSRCIPDLSVGTRYDVARVARWEPYGLCDVALASWVGSVPYRSCTTSHNDR